MVTSSHTHSPGHCFFDLCVNFTSHVCVFQEDFQAMTYGFKMANNVTDLRVTGITHTLWMYDMLRQQMQALFGSNVRQLTFQNGALQI